MTNKLEEWRQLCPGRHLNELNHSLCRALSEACNRIEALEAQNANYQALVEADQAFGKLMAQKCDALEGRLAAADYLAYVADEFLNDFCEERSCVPGRLQRALEAWRLAKGGEK